MITCPACGKENEDAAYECKRCRAPLRDGGADETTAAAPSSGALGEVCRHCETFNEPGVRVCTNCGQELFAPQAAPMTPPTQKAASISEELSALALSDQEAAEAGALVGNGTPQMEKTPVEPFAATPPAVPQRSKTVDLAAAAFGVGLAATRREPPPPPPPPVRPPSAVERAAPVERAPAAPTEKPCANCGAMNPPAAKFCFDCGTPFFKKPEAPKLAEPPRAKPASAEPPPSIQIDASLTEGYEEETEQAEEQAAHGGWEEPAPAASMAEPVPEEPPADAAVEAPPEEPSPPFSASVVIEKGHTAGSVITLAHLENTIGGAGAHVELGEDRYVAPHAATLMFAEDRLVLRDEGSANGVYVKVRESASIVPGDLFIAGERLFRYEGPTELARAGESDTPFLGAPRPVGLAVRITEVLAGAKTGRTCHRAGPAIAIGRTGCDMNFPADGMLAARHAEIRVGEDGGATLVDLGQSAAGVFVRVRPQEAVDLQAGDILQVGEQVLRVEVG